MFRRVALVACVGLLTTCGLAAAGPREASSAAASGAADGRWVMGYYAVYQRSMMPINEIDWSAMTHLVVAAVVPKPDGSLDTTFYDNAQQGPKLAKALAAKAKAHGVVPLLMVGGAGTHDDFAAAATNHLSTLVNNLLSTMRAYGYDGLDLDWEPVDHGDGPIIEKLVSALRKRAPDAVLTMPVLWVTTTFPSVPSWYGTLAKKLDRIDVMTYGMAGAYQGWETWHSSALTGATSSTPSDVAINVQAYEKAGVPARKLGIGIGFYGTCWAGGVTGPRQPIGSSYVSADDNVMTYTRIMSTYYSPSAYHYDSVAQAPYLSFSSPTGPQQCTFVSYENPRSVAAKGAYAEKHDLGAEIVWTINEGHVKGAPAVRADPLLSAVRNAFH